MMTQGDLVSEAEPLGTPIGLDALAEANSTVNMLLAITRSGARPPLDKAVAQMKALPFVRPDDMPVIEEAARLIRLEQRLLLEAREPAAVTSGGFESWYAGARRTDPCWGGMREMLVAAGWSDAAITDLNDASDRIVAYLPNPVGPLSGKTRALGLVLGYVQSGKTTNFTAVINKAADAGYRCFIILSGLHNGLREQTQARLVEHVCELNKGSWRMLTEPEADFSPTANVDADLLAYTDAGEPQPVLIVIKKNISRLTRLKGWLEGATSATLERCPVLIIDDEADQASINTAGTGADSPSKINGAIREILKLLPRSAFVGYTATPFANVFIDPAEYEDLYPRDFIVDLPRPDDYIGPEALFGSEPLAFDPDGTLADGYDLIRSITVEEATALRKRGAPIDVDADAPAMDEALRYFLLSTAARRVRRAGNRHATALVHTSQYVASHFAVAQAIEARVSTWRTALASRDEAFVDELRTQWDAEVRRVPASEFAHTAVKFDELEPELAKVAADIAVVVDNSTSQDRLDYSGERARTVVAVGGNTLSRGLTLEGLSVSYFIRTASAYDTALQMGRWFGYRAGYGDLTRIWMTDEMRGWFHHLATVEAEIRADIGRYEIEHVTPEELAIAIRTHPKMAITSASKMRTAVDASVSYSGRRIQTILFWHEDGEWLASNLEAGRNLIRVARGQGYPVTRPAMKSEGSWVVGPVPSELITTFLESYRFHANSRDLNSELIGRYIRERMRDDELTHFHIAVMGRKAIADLGTVDLGLDELVGAINRAPLDHVDTPEYADIKVLTSKADRVIDLGLSDEDLRGMSAGEIANLRNLPPRGKGDGTGLLLLYPISRNSRKDPESQTRCDLNAVDDILGVSLVFPASRSALPIGYKTADLSGVVLEEPDGLPDKEGALDA